MNITNVNSPCVNCSERNEGCHPNCTKYKKYKFLCQIERQRNFKEKEVNAAVNEIISSGVNGRKTNTPEQLKHGRKTN